MSVRWNTTKLLNVAYIASGQGAPQLASDFNDVGIPFVRAGSLDFLVKGGNENDCEHITEEAAKKYGLKLFAPGTVLFAKSGMSAKLDRIYQLKSDAYVVNHLAAVVPSDNCDSTFLKYWFQANPPSRLIKDESYPSIRLSDIEEIEIPLPPLDEQRRIATILDKADAIRQKRQESIRLTEEFLRSTFLDMFGDPVMNPRNWKVEALGTVIGFMTSGSRGWAQYYSKSGARFLRIQNVGKNKLLLDDVAYVLPPDNAETIRTKVEAGDILLSITADLGRSAVIPDGFGDAYINQHLALLRVKKGSPLYYSAFIASEGGQRQIAALNKGGVKAGLNFNDVRALQIPIPPAQMQEKWALIYKQHPAFLYQEPSQFSPGFLQARR